MNSILFGYFDMIEQYCAPKPNKQHLPIFITGLLRTVILPVSYFEDEEISALGIGVVLFY